MEDIQLTASLPHEMIQSQQTLISWMEKKIAICIQEATELQEAFEHAKKSGWKHTVLNRHQQLAWRRVNYYEKIKSALREGYHIVPNFPVEIFAIRTERKNPLQMLSCSHWDQRIQSAAELPIAEGEYKNPRPIIFQQHNKDENGKIVDTDYWAEDWQDIEFPISMAKPEIMELTSRAMALEIFDQIGILPAVHKNDDPVILGQIIRKDSSRNVKIVSFMIAWHLNTNML